MQGANAPEQRELEKLLNERDPLAAEYLATRLTSVTKRRGTARRYTPKKVVDELRGPLILLARVSEASSREMAEDHDEEPLSRGRPRDTVTRKAVVSLAGVHDVIAGAPSAAAGVSRIRFCAQFFNELRHLATGFVPPTERTIREILQSQSREKSRARK